MSFLLKMLYEISQACLSIIPIMACNVKFCVSVVLNEKRGSVLNPNSVKSTDLNSFCVHN